MASQKIFGPATQIGCLLVVLILTACDSDDTPGPPPTNGDPTPQWQQSLGGTKNDEFPIIQETPDGGYIFAASTFSDDGDVSSNHNTDYADIWLVKIDVSGNILWEETYGGSVQESPQALLQLNDGGFLIGGISNSLDGDVGWNNGSIDWWMVRLDAAREIIWEQNLGGSLHEAPRVAIQNGNEFIIAGATASNDGDIGNKTDIDGDLWIVRMDDTGSILSEKTYGVSSKDEGAVNLFPLAGSGYFMAGNASGDVWLVMFDANLEVVWEKLLGGSNYEMLVSAISNQSGYLLAVTSESSDGDVSENFGGSDIWMVQIDHDANVIWERSFGGSDTELASGIVPINDGGYWVAGTSGSNDGQPTTNQGGLDWWVMRLDSDGNLLWDQTYGGSDFERVRSLARAGNSGVLIAGQTRSSDGDVQLNNGNDDVWLMMIE